MKRAACSLAALGILLLAAGCNEQPPGAPKRTEPVEAASPPLAGRRKGDDSCRAASDCMKSTLTETCCDGCETLAQSRTHFTSEHDHCTGGASNRQCPKLDCPFERKEVDCVKGMCILRAPSFLQVTETSVWKLVPAARPPSAAAAALEVPEATYKPIAADGGEPKAYAVAFQDDDSKLEIYADPRIFKGKLAATQPAANTKVYLLDDGFGGGRFTVQTQPDGARRATLTVFGSGVPIISSERGPLVAGK